MTTTEQIKQKAKGLGFELVGVAQAQPAPDFDFFRWWLDQGYAGTMDYLRRGAERRGDPGKILPGVRSIICCGLNYNTGISSGPISNYAWGDDYHEVVGLKLEALEKFIREIAPEAVTKRYVDTGAILERSYAARAGLGWIGKNTCLLNNGVGSYIFLGEILTTLGLTPDRPALDQCGSCTKCLEACPTGALVEPYTLDANRCISYLTIEYRGDFSPEQAALVGDPLRDESPRPVYGCDLCQQVCPYNDRIPITGESRFFPRAVFKDRPPAMLKRASLEKVSEGEFAELRKGSAMARITWRQWRRNLTGC